MTATTVITGFSVTQIEETGSANINHTLIANGIGDGYVGLGILGNSTKPINIQNSSFEQMHHPIVVTPNALHRLHMDNVTFANNLSNRVFIYGYPDDALADNVRLTPQPGLEGYEYQFFNSPNPLTIPDGITLTLEAGTALMMPQGSSVQVNGHLAAAGMAVAPVNFTSSEDNAPGQWAGIVVDGGEVSLAHAEVRYATTNLTVNSPTSTVTITSSRLISASVNSIAVYDGTLHAACSVIAGNGQNGVSISASGTPSVTITTSEIWGNGVGITNSHSLPVDARFNFWGDLSGPGGIGLGSGDAVYGNVLYEPWLTETECLPPTAPIFTVYLPIIGKP